MSAEIKNSGIPIELVRDAVTRTLKSRIEEINQKSNDIYESMKYFENFEWKASSEIFNELTKPGNIHLIFDTKPSSSHNKV